jgi:hypothetical protein
MEDTLMGSAIVIWDRRNVTALRWAGWASVPIDISGRLLDKEFWLLKRTSSGYHRANLDNTIYCQLESWRRLMGTWKTRGSAMTIREFDGDRDDADCACFRLAAGQEARQAENDAVEEQEHPTKVFLAQGDKRSETPPS